jgi:aminotransferase
MSKVEGLSSQIIQSEIRNMSIECAKIGGINLSQGFSGTEIQIPISLGAKDAIDRGINHYTRYDGIQELREAISNKLKYYNNITADPEAEVLVTSGSTAALFCVLFALFKPQDEIILFEPYYGYHVNTIFAVSMIPKYLPLIPSSWSIDYERLESLITPKTKAIIVNTPTNPSGKVFSKEELLRLGRMAKKHNIYIITDEIYEYFLYDDAVHISPASIPEIRDTVITISGYSKTFSITGWRIGYIVCPKELSQTIGFVHDLIYVCAPAPLQMGVCEGIEKLNDGFYLDLKKMYQKKRDMMCEALEKSGLVPIIPKGAYYVLADVSKIPGVTSKEKMMNFLKKTKIAAVPGEAFYHNNTGNGIARFCFAKRDNVLSEAANILKSIRF